MKRPTTILGAIVLSVAVQSTPDSKAGELDVIKSRLAVLETRVSALENSVSTGANFKSVSSIKTTATQQKKTTHYVIKEGDTISEIARSNGVPRSELMEINGIREGQQIFIGDRLVIPSPPVQKTSPPSAHNYVNVKATPKELAPAPPAAGNQASHTFYTVKYGDTLSAISRKTGASVAVIRAANNMRSDRIVGGQRLKIPASDASSSVVSAAPATIKKDSQPPKSSGAEKVYDNPLLRDEESYGEYTVQKGDNLYALARDFFTTMKELQRLNQLGSSTLIFPGNKLVVPTSKYNNYHNKVAKR